MTVGATRFLQVIALDANGRSVSPKVRWNIPKGGEYGTIHPTTGELTATKQGVITVQVAVDSKVASATITVQPDSATALKQIMEKTQEQARNQESSSPTLVGKLGGADGEDQYPGTGGDETVTDQLAAGLQQSQTQVREKTGTQQATQAALELFAQEQTANRLLETGGKSTTPTQAQVNVVVQAQNTITQKMAVRFTAAVQEMAQTIKQILVGQIVQNEAGETYRIKSVAQHLGDLIRRLFFGGTATEQEPGAGAGSGLMRLEGGEGGGGEQN